MQICLLFLIMFRNIVKKSSRCLNLHQSFKELTLFQEFYEFVLFKLLPGSNKIKWYLVASMALLLQPLKWALFLTALKCRWLAKNHAKNFTSISEAKPLGSQNLTSPHPPPPSAFLMVCS